MNSENSKSAPSASRCYAVVISDGRVVFSDCTKAEAEYFAASLPKHVFAKVKTLSQISFESYLEQASETVASWPNWKRGVLEMSMKAMNVEPRPRIIDGKEWYKPETKPGCGDSIWIAVLEHDGENVHVDYAVTFADTDGLIVHRYETKGYELWPPKDVLAWSVCEVPTYRK